MNDFTNTATSKSLTLKLWRGERMCLIAMDVANPEPDFVGFSIEVKSPGETAFMPLRNRIAFSYPKPPRLPLPLRSSSLHSRRPSRNSVGPLPAEP